MNGCKRKLLGGWKYALYYRDAITLNSRSDPKLVEKMVSVLVEEGVPKRLIRRLSREFGLLDFEAHTDSPIDPKAVIITVCTFFRKDNSSSAIARKEILRIPIDREERSKLFLPGESVSWKVTGGGMVADSLAQ